MDSATALTTDTAAACVQRHRIAARRARTRLQEAIQALELAMESRPRIEQEIRKATAGDPNGRRRAAMLQAVSPQAHAAALRSLTASLAKVIALKRQAWGIQPDWTPEPEAPAQAPRDDQQALDRVFDEIRRRVKRRLQDHGPQA